MELTRRSAGGISRVLRRRLADRRGSIPTRTAGLSLHVSFESDAEQSANRTTFARSDIRQSEAARMLGLLQAGDLADRARQWLSAGFDTANVRALAGAAEATDGVRLALVGEIAAEHGLGFATIQDARRAHAEQIIRSIGAGEFATPQLYALSNGFTDEWMSRLRHLVARVRAATGSRPRDAGSGPPGPARSDRGSK